MHIEVNDNASTKSSITIDVENNPDSFKEVLQASGHKLNQNSCGVILTLATKTPGKKGEIPGPVTELIDAVHSIAREANGVFVEKWSDYIKVVHENSKLQIILDMNGTIMDGIFASSVHSCFERWKEYGLNFNFKMATAMTLNSVVEKVTSSNLGKPRSQL